MDNEYDKSGKRTQGYAIKLKCRRKSDSKIVIIYFEGFVYQEKYRKLLYNKAKSFICSRKVHWGFSYLGHMYTETVFGSISWLGVPLLGLCTCIALYAAVYAKKEDGQKVVKDLKNHTNQIIKAPLSCEWLKEIVNIELVKFNRDEML